MSTEHVEEQDREQGSGGNTSDGRAKGGRWTKGYCPNPNGRRGKASEDDAEEEREDDGLSTAKKLRKVADQPPSKDRGGFEKALRKLFNDDLDKFLLRLTAAERAESGRTDNSPPLTGDGPETTDAGTDRAVEMARRCLAELAAKHAEKGECPECGSKLPAGQGRDGRPITNGVHR